MFKTRDTDATLTRFLSSMVYGALVVIAAIGKLGVQTTSFVNVPAHATRRVDLTVGVGDGDDLNKAQRIMEEMLSADARVLKEPALTIAVANLGDSSVDFVVRPWVNAADY